MKESVCCEFGCQNFVLYIFGDHDGTVKGYCPSNSTLEFSLTSPSITSEEETSSTSNVVQAADEAQREVDKVPPNSSVRELMDLGNWSLVWLMMTFVNL